MQFLFVCGDLKCSGVLKWLKTQDGPVDNTLGQMSSHSQCAVPKAVMPEGKESFGKAILLFQIQQLLHLQTLVRDCRNPAAQNRLLQTLGNTEELPPHCECSSKSHQLSLNVEMTLLLLLCSRIEFRSCLNCFGACRKEVLSMSFNFFKGHQCFSLKPYLQCFSAIK